LYAVVTLGPTRPPPVLVVKLDLILRPSALTLLTYDRDLESTSLSLPVPHLKLAALVLVGTGSRFQVEDFPTIRKDLNVGLDLLDL
jgi:hypothetical protein